MPCARRIWFLPEASPTRRRRSRLSLPEGNRYPTLSTLLHTSIPLFFRSRRFGALIQTERRGTSLALLLGNLFLPAACGWKNNLPNNLPVHHGGPKDGLPLACTRTSKCAGRASRIHADQSGARNDTIVNILRLT